MKISFGSFKSHVDTSDEKRDNIRPIGVVSKKLSRERIIPNSIIL